MIPAQDLLPARVLRRPTDIATFVPSDWDLLIRQSRAANVLARIASVLAEAGLLGSVPDGPRAHLVSAARLGKQQQVSATYEIDCICLALTTAKVTPILLKGAAYLAANLDAASGRLFADIDILVPFERLAEVESALMLNGWKTTDPDEYDQRYYRRWMHELPPMRHMRRDTTIDVHHTILPPTAGRKLDAFKLIGDATPGANNQRIKVLAPVDMVLHSMTHLFYDGELQHGFRDLVDLDSLLRQGGSRLPGFLDALWPRARELDLELPLFYGLRYVVAFLDTPIPAELRESVTSAGPKGVALRCMDSLFLRALRPPHSSCIDGLTPLARWLLYVRAHWLRMPFPLLMWHLGRKALRRRPDVASVTDDAGQ